MNRHQQTDIVIVAETVAILKTRDSFNETLFLKFIKDAGWIFVVPLEVTPEWVNRIADALADKFAVWQAGGMQ